MESDIGFQAALGEARKGAAEGGVPIGACLVGADGKILVGATEVVMGSGLIDV